MPASGTPIPGTRSAARCFIEAPFAAPRLRPPAGGFARRSLTLVTASEDMTARIWEIPPPQDDSPERIVRRLEVDTGMVLDAPASVPDSLTPAAWCPAPSRAGCRGRAEGAGRAADCDRASTGPSPLNDPAPPLRGRVSREETNSTKFGLFTSFMSSVSSTLGPRFKVMIAFFPLEGLRRIQLARPRYSPVRVSTRTTTPWSRCSGTWTTWPVESVAGLVRPVAELPRTPGAVSVIGSSTVSGSSMAMTSSSTTRASTPSMFSVMNEALVAQVVGGERELVEVGRVHEVELVGVAVEVLDRPPLEARLVQRVGPPVRLLDAVLGLEVAGLDLVERGRPSRRGGLDLDLLDHVRGAVDLDDHPPLEILGGDHGSRPSLASMAYQHESGKCILRILCIKRR